MLREQAKLVNRISFVVNALVVSAAFALAYLLRQQYAPPLQPFSRYAWVLLVILPVWLYLLTKYQLFSSLRYLSPADLLSHLFMVQMWGGIIVSAVVFFADRDAFSRGLIVAFVVLSGLFLLLLHVSRRLLLGAFRRYGYNYRRLLVVGTMESSRRFLELVREHADWGIRVAGFVQLNGETAKTVEGGHPVLGCIGDLVEICKQHPVDEVVFCLPGEDIRLAEEYVGALEELGTTSRVVMNFYENKQARREWSLFHGELPILTICNKCLDAQQLFLKRVLDLTGATVGLFLLLLMLPFVALAIKLDSPGPIFFGQERIGMNGRRFRCWKFRSMQVDAEVRKQELLARNEMQGAIFKLSDDPRITRVGRFLRKSSLDEFPQFWNVLKGEMSLVGTRPPTSDEVAAYQNWHMRRISIKPGITGLWQVSGRNQIADFDEIVRLDIRYIESWSLWLDIRILLKTCWVLFARRGAC
jgi:exopolysaccharide biosynthesis polyprenyl glycosylphosphotransferase